MVRRTDRRVQRTRKLLRESLLALILKEGYDAISIQDITDKANLGRATFYLHFKDKDELLLDVMDQLIADFFNEVPQLSEEQWRLEDTKALNKIFNFAADHYDLYRILIMGSGGISASRQLKISVAENLLTCIQKEIQISGVHPVIPSVFIANHFAGSLLSTIYWWLENNLPYGADEMAGMFQKIHKLDRDTLMGYQINEASDVTKTKGKKRRKANKKRNKEEQIFSLAEDDQVKIPLGTEDKTEDEGVQ